MHIQKIYTYILLFDGRLADSFHFLYSVYHVFISKNSTIRKSQISHLPWALSPSCPAPLPSGSSSSSSSSPEPCRCCCRCWVTCSQNSSMAEHTKEQDPHSHWSPRFSFRRTFAGGGMAFTLEEEEIHSYKDSTKCCWGRTGAQPAKNRQAFLPWPSRNS